MSDYSATFPSQRPVFSQDFAQSGKIDPRATFSRASTGSYFGTEKVLSSENLLLQSQDFDTTWNTTGVTLSGSVAAPDGTSTAWTLTPTTGATGHFIQQSFTINANNEYTAVAHIKAGAATHGWVLLRSQYTTYCYAQLEFSTSTLTTGGAGWTGVTGTKTELGSGWFKITLTGTAPSAATSPYMRIGINDGTAFNASGYPTWTPAGTETLLAWGAQVNTTGATVYDSPTTTQMARSYQTKLQTAASGAARFEHSATDGQSAGTSLGILVEGQSTNYLAGSATIGGTYWGVANATAQQNSAVAPDGTLTATTLVENSAGGAKYAYSNNYTPAASTTYTFSVFVKPNGRNFCMIYTNLGGAGQSSMFDLVTGSTSNLSGSGTNQANQCGNGWWRLSVTVTTTSTTAANFQILTASDATTIDYTGNGYSGLLCWGAMLEQSSHASSYIGTTTTAVTRAADSLSVATADIGYTGGPVTLFVEGSQDTPSADANSRAMLELTETGGSTNRVLIYNYPGLGGGVWANADSAITASINGTISSSNAFKVGLSYDTNSIARSIDGGAVTEDTSGQLPEGMDKLFIGSGQYVGQVDGHIKRVAVYSEALSDTNLQALTS